MTLEGARVRLEPLEARHEEELWAIAQDERVWRLMRVRGNESREVFHEWFESVDLGFAHSFDDVLVGHTSYLNVHSDDRTVEIGNTWLVPSAWGTGANSEAKLLMLGHAFEALGCEGLARVDFFLMPDGSIVLNEINTMPGFTTTSMFPQMWAASGVSYAELVDRLITEALSRPTGLR